MEKALTTTQSYSKDQIELIKRTVAKGSTDDELKMFLHIAKRTGLDPFVRQIYSIRRWNSDIGGFSMVTQTGIDGQRLIAERTGKYAPGKDVEYQYDENGVLISATAFVMKMIGDKWFEVPATARFTEYAVKKKDGTLTAMWKDKPHVMLGKCAESLALRKAFPNEMSGVYTEEEMGDVAVEPEQAVEVKKEELKPKGANEKMNPAQLKWFHTQISKAQINKQTVKEYIFDQYGKESSKDLTLEEANELIKWASGAPKNETIEAEVVK